MPWLLLGVAGLALLMLSGRRSAGGWTKANTGIVLSPAAVAWLDRLRAAVPSSIPIVVTSGTRTARSQARAMLAMVELGPDGVRQAYTDYPDDLVDELLALPRTLEAWEPRVARAYASGELASSGHLAGMAVDLRRRDWSAAQLETVVAAIKRLGGKPLVESAPPHVHVQLPASAAAAAPPPSSPPPSSSSTDATSDLVPELDLVSFEDDADWSEP